MLRNALVAVSLLIVGGFVVALVNAQDLVRRSAEPPRSATEGGGQSSILKSRSRVSGVRVSAPTSLAEPGSLAEKGALAEPGSFPRGSGPSSAQPLSATGKTLSATGKPLSATGKTGAANTMAGASGSVGASGPETRGPETGGLQSVLKRRLREQPAATVAHELAGDDPSSSRRQQAKTIVEVPAEPLREPALYRESPRNATPSLNGPRAASAPLELPPAQPAETTASQAPPTLGTSLDPRQTTSTIDSSIRPRVQSYSDRRPTAGAEPRRLASRPTVKRSPVSEVPANVLPGIGASGTESPAKRERASSVALLSSEAPAVRVEAKGPAAITLGKEATYTVQAFNRGDKPAVGVLVHVTLPRTIQVAGTETVSGTVERRTIGLDAGHVVWTIDEIAAGSNAQLEIKIVPQQAQPFQVGVEWSFRPLVARSEILVQQPKLDISIGGPKDMLFGETKVYTLTLTNPGTGDAENVAVTLGNSPTSGVTKQLGRLAAGERRELDVELTARDAGSMEIQALALADGGLRSEASISVRVRRARLEVKVVGPARRFANSSATYEVRVSNVGDAVAQDVLASLSLAKGARYTGGAAGASTRAGRIQWPVGQLNPGSDKVFRLQFELSLPGENQVEARVLATGDLAAADAIVTRVEALADLKLIVDDPQGPKSIGEEVVYEVTVANRGTKSAKNISVVTQFSDGIEPVRAEGAEAEIVPGQVIFKTIAELAPGERIVLKIVAKADKEGNHLFRAEVNCSDPETRLVTEETTRYFASSVLGP